MNRGLSVKLKESFSDVTPVQRPEIKNIEIKDPH
jgi:hypothetical protein